MVVQLHEFGRTAIHSQFESPGENNQAIGEPGCTTPHPKVVGH